MQFSEFHERMICWGFYFFTLKRTLKWANLLDMSNIVARGWIRQLASSLAVIDNSHSRAILIKRRTSSPSILVHAPVFLFSPPFPIPSLYENLRTCTIGWGGRLLAVAGAK